jgi:hypothetical protein
MRKQRNGCAAICFEGIRGTASDTQTNSTAANSHRRNADVFREWIATKLLTAKKVVDFRYEKFARRDFSTATHTRASSFFS